jgi:RNA polymerase sigma-70 factor (ECF subfamily)
MAAIGPEQLAAWFDALAAPLKLYARQWLDAAAAEDVVQEAFLSLMAQNLPPANLRAWLFRAVRNGAVSAVRSRVRRSRREQQVAAERGGYFEPSPADLIDARAAQEAMEGLPQPQREVVVLRLWGQLTLAEIAGLVGSPISTVHDQYRAALARIRKQLESPCKKTN